jgi:signal transduction histidine kinase
MTADRPPLFRFCLLALWLVVPFAVLLGLTLRAWRSDAETRRTRLIAEARETAECALTELDRALGGWSAFPAQDTISEPPLPVTDPASQAARERYDTGDFEGVLGSTDAVRSPAGLRLRALAALQLLRKETMPARLAELADVLVQTMDFTSPPLLEEAVRRFEDLKLTPPPTLAEWEDAWADLRSQAALARAIREHPPAATTFWLQQDPDPEPYLVETNPLTGQWRTRGYHGVVGTMKSLNLPALARGLAVRVSVAGRTVGGVCGKQSFGGDLYTESSVLAGVTRGPWTADVALMNQGTFAADDALTRRFMAGVLIAAGLAVLFGLWQAGRAYLRAVELAERQAGFMAAVSHEMRTPLAAMRLLAENLESGVADRAGERDDHVRLLRGECARLSTLVENVLAYTGKAQEFLPEPLDLSALLADLTEMIRPLAERHGIHLETSVEPLPESPQGDAPALRRALLNLLDNALKHTPDGGTVRCEIRAAAPAHWQIEVSDTGPGVPEAERERIFEPFYRIGSELRRTTPGVGLGLALVQRTAFEHCGQVAVADSPDGGARFTLTLPLHMYFGHP